MTIGRLYLDSPAVIFTGRVNQTSFTYPLAAVTFDGGTALGTVAVGQTVVFGSAVGKGDRGRQRVRAGSSMGTTGTLNIGRSSRGVLDGEVDLEDDLYITIFGDRRVWAVAPNEDGFPAYKDHDIAVGDFNTESPPVANIGGPKDAGFAATINATTSVITVTLPGTGSFATADGASITDYLWNVDDGTITVGTTASNTITATFPAGFRHVTLTVTDSNGLTHTQSYPVYARNPASDTTIAHQVAERVRRADGQEISFRILQDIHVDDYPEGFFVMYWEGEPTSATDRSHMQFVGWHQADSNSIAAERTGTLNDTVIRCVDAAGRLKALPGFPQIVGRSEDGYLDWSAVPAGNRHMDWYLWYLLHWHSTVLDVVYWSWTGTTSTYPFVSLGSDGESLFEQVNRKANSLVPDYHLTCTRQGGLQTVIDPMLQDAGDRTATVQLSVSEARWRETSWEHTAIPRVYWLWGDAIVATSAPIGNDIPTAFCVAPGTAPGQGLSENDHGQQLAVSQDDLNSCEGHRYARLNAPAGPLSIGLTSGAGSIEPADMTWVQVTISAGNETRRGFGLNVARGLPLEVSYGYDYRREGTLVTAELLWERETEGTAPAVTHVPPAGDDSWDDDWGDWEIPPPEPGLTGLQNHIITVNNDGYQYKTANFQTPSAQGGPTWTRADMGLDGTPLSFVVDAFSPLYLGTGNTVNYWVVTTTDIYFVEDAFGVDGAPSVASQHTFATALTDAVKSGRTIQATFGNFFGDNTAWVMVSSYYSVDEAIHGTRIIYSDDHGATWSSEITVSGHYSTGAGYAVTAPALFLSSKTPGLAYTAGFLSTADFPTADGYVTADWGATWARISNPDIQPGVTLGITIHVPWMTNPDENILYHSWASAPGGNLGNFSLVRVSGTTRTDASPVGSDGNTYGIRNTGQWGVRAFDSDRRFVVLNGYYRNSAGTIRRHAAFVSADYGATWTEIIPPTEQGASNAREVAFGSDSQNVIYIWGNNYMAFSGNFGASVDDRRGNMASLGTPGIFIGIAGGG